MEVLIWCHLLDGKCCASVTPLCLNAETFRRLHTSQRCCASRVLSPLLMLGHSTQPCLPWQATRRGGVVGRYSVSVLLKQIIAGILMIIEMEEMTELLQGV